MVGVSEVAPIESLEITPIKAIFPSAKIKELPSGVKLHCYTTEHWKKLLSSYPQAQAYGICTKYIKEEAATMGERLNMLNDTLDKTEKDLQAIDFDYNKNIQELKKDLATMKNTYESCKAESNIDINADGSVRFKNTKLDKSSSFFINCLIEFKEFQISAQHFRSSISSMLNSVREMRSAYKQNSKNNKANPANAKATSSNTNVKQNNNNQNNSPNQLNLEKSKIVKTDLSTLEGSTLDLLDISDNTILNTIALVAAVHEFSAEERYTGDVKKRKDSLFTKKK